METYVLMFQLLRSDPVHLMPVNDCEVAIAWMREARAWAERSGIEPVNGPVYACGPADAPPMQLVKQ